MPKLDPAGEFENSDAKYGNLQCLLEITRLDNQKLGEESLRIKNSTQNEHQVILGPEKDQTIT